MAGIYAVITGDIIRSTRYSTDIWRELNKAIKAAFDELHDLFRADLHSNFELFRGDSFQCAIKNPRIALRLIILLISLLRVKSGSIVKEDPLKAKIAIGIGGINYLKKGSSESMGEAFQYSGDLLDAIRSRDRQKIQIRSPWEEINGELMTGVALLEALINRWSLEQAEAMIQHLLGLKQIEIADRLGISQPAVVHRLHLAGSWAVDLLLKRYDFIMDARLGRIVDY